MAAEDSVLQYMAGNPGASITEISDAIVAYGADLDTLADMMNVSRADARAAFAPTPAASESDDGFDIMEALGLVGNINSSLSGASSFPANQSPIIMNATPAGVGPNSEYALSASSEDDGNNVNLSSVAGSANQAISGLQAYNTADTVAGQAAGLGGFTGGLGSVVGAVSGQESTAESLVLNLLSSNPATAPFALAYRLLDALGFFDGGGLEATSMTPEQREMANAAAKVSQALARQEGSGFGNNEDSEAMGAEAYLLRCL
jgi:hypothetical protein